MRGKTLFVAILVILLSIIVLVHKFVGTVPAVALSIFLGYNLDGLYKEFVG